MSEFRMTITPRTDRTAAAAPSSGSSVRTPGPATQCVPAIQAALQCVGPTGPTDAVSPELIANTPAMQCVPRTPALQSIARTPALQSIMRTPEAR